MSEKSADGNDLNRCKVVVVGAGFAGFQCALKLASDPNIQVTLLDKNNYHVFQPLLYQVGTGLLSPHNAAFNLRALLHRHPNVQVKMSEIVSVDLETHTAYGKAGDVHQGDYLVLAAGGEATFLGVPGAETHTFPLYSLRDAERLRCKLIEIFEAEELQEAGARQSLDIVIVGAGATGVEVAGALADRTERAQDQLFRSVDLHRVTITVVDSGATVLGPFQKKCQEFALATLQARNVQFRFGCHVKEVTDRDVLLADGSRLPSSIVVWAAGLKAARLSDGSGLTAGHGGRIDVQADLSVPGHPRVYALGDFANCSNERGGQLPQLASVAKQAGTHCALNIRAQRRGAPQKPFSYFDNGIMAMIGRNAAVAEIGKKRRVLVGPLAFLAWIGVHVLLLNTFRVKLQTAVEWLSEYLGKVNVATILDK